MNAYEPGPMLLKALEEFLALRQSQIHFRCFPGDDFARRDLLVALNGMHLAFSESCCCHI